MINRTEKKSNNAKIAYEYIQYFYDKTEEGIDRVNGRLTTLLASSGVLLKFSFDLNDHVPSLAITKIISCILLIIVIGLCLRGLLPGYSGQNAKLPSDLLDEGWLNDNEDSVWEHIATGLEEARKEVKERYSTKASFLTKAYYGTFFVGVTFGINVIIGICLKGFP